MSDKLYADRDIMELDVEGNHYCNHVMAMTSEKLHCKSDIAAELGHRDSVIKELTAQLDAMKAEQEKLLADMGGKLKSLRYSCDNEVCSSIRYEQKLIARGFGVAMHMVQLSPPEDK
tara:strand:- start:130 stop:480 length:351 start_codon:yes stop_codon:yes gene_type:complete